MARYIDAVECADIISDKLNIPLGDLVDVFAYAHCSLCGAKMDGGKDGNL